MATALEKHREMVQQQIDIDKQANAARAAREAELVAVDYSAKPNLDSLYEGLSVADIKFLYLNSASFKQATDRFNQVAVKDPFAGDVDETNVIELFRALPEAQQKTEFDRLKPELQAVINADYDRFSALTPEEQTAELAGIQPATVEPPAVLTPEQQADADAAAAAQAETDRLAAEAAARAAQPVEVLFEGVEKIGEGSYKLTVDPGDGTPLEIFYGATQAELFAKLRKSKANATKEIRRRKKALEITTEMKALEVEKINYAPPVQPLTLNPDEIFQLTEDLKDPSKVLVASAKLRQASLTPEECARQNEAIERQRFSDGYNVGMTWMSVNGDKFYRDEAGENIKNLQKVMGDLNWAMTMHNLDLAFNILKEQAVLVSPPEDEEPNQPIVSQPASVVPVVAAVPAVVPAPVPAAAAPAVPVVPSTTAPATTGGLPVAGKVLRPGSSTTSGMPTRRIEPSSRPAAPALVLTAEEYHATPAATLKIKMQRDPAYKAAVEALWAAGVR